MFYLIEESKLEKFNLFNFILFKKDYSCFIEEGKSEELLLILIWLKFEKLLIKCNLFEFNLFQKLEKFHLFFNLIYLAS